MNNKNLTFIKEYIYFILLEVELGLGAERDALGLGILLSESAGAKLVVSESVGSAELAAGDGDLVRVAAAGAAGEELAGAVGGVDDGHAGGVLDPAGGAAVDNSEGGACGPLAALELGVAAEAHGRGGVGPVAVAAGGAASSGLVTEAGEVVLLVGGNVGAAAALARAAVVRRVGGACNSSHQDHSDDELHWERK